jgi:hypothetical protein
MCPRIQFCIHHVYVMLRFCKKVKTTVLYSEYMATDIRNLFVINHDVTSSKEDNSFLLLSELSEKGYGAYFDDRREA